MKRSSPIYIDVLAEVHCDGDETLHEVESDMCWVRRCWCTALVYTVSRIALLKSQVVCTVRVVRWWYSTCVCSIMHCLSGRRYVLSERIVVCITRDNVARGIKLVKGGQKTVLKTRVCGGCSEVCVRVCNTAYYG